MKFKVGDKVKFKVVVTFLSSNWANLEGVARVTEVLYHNQYRVTIIESNKPPPTRHSVFFFGEELSPLCRSYKQIFLNELKDKTNDL